MDKIATIYVHTDNDDKKEIAKRIFNMAVLRDTGSLVAWYPDLGDDGLQGVFVTDGIHENIVAAFGRHWQTLAQLEIKWDYKIQRVTDVKIWDD